MSGKFEVHPEDLRLVAKRIKALHETIAGVGGVDGNKQYFKDNASSDQIHNAMKTFLSDENDDAYKTAYDKEFSNIDATYQVLIDQLKTLETACNTTAKTYEDQDHDTKKAINRPAED